MKENRKSNEGERRDWLIFLLILLIGIVLMLCAGQSAVAMLPRWSVEADVNSNLNPNDSYVKQQLVIVEPIKLEILTPPAWKDLILTPQAIPTGTATVIPVGVIGTSTVTGTVTPTGSLTVTLGPTNTSVSTFTRTPTANTTASRTHTATPSRTNTIVGTSTYTNTPGTLPTATRTPTSPPVSTSTNTSTPVNTATSTNTLTPSNTPIPSTNTPTNTSIFTQTLTPTETNTPTNTPVPGVTMCGSPSSSSLTGTIIDSGGSSANYNNNESCGFLIASGAPSASISLSFSSFNVEQSYDFLRIYDGTDTSGTLIGTFTGTTVPSGSYIASSGNMYLLFTSDNNITAPGFIANWSTTINPVDNALCTSNTSSDQIVGNILDSGGAASDYRNSEACTFLIQPGGGGSYITLSFAQFETQSNRDFLRVYDGTDATGTLLGAFSGNTPPSPLTATSGSMFLRWTSNPSITFPGFIASWSSIAYTPTPSNTPTNTATFTPTATPTFTPTHTPTFTHTYTPSNTPTVTNTHTSTFTPTNTHTPTYTFTPSQTYTQTNTPTQTDTPTETPTFTVTYTPSDTPTSTPTLTPSETPTPTDTPTISNTPTSTLTLSDTPTATFTFTPSNTPTQTDTPTSTPTRTPTFTPTETETITPSNTPSITNTPSHTPTQTDTPTSTPTFTPSNTSTVTDTPTPSHTPTITNTPTHTSTWTPTFTYTPSHTPTITNTPTETGYRMCSSFSTSDMTGILRDSGGSAANYANNENCTFLISSGVPSASIVLTFSSFRVEDNWDELSVYDGVNASGVLLGTFSGDSIPSDIVASSGNMFLQFTSDNNITDQGFSASWTITVPPPSDTMCTSGTMSSQPSGSITDSGGASSNYRNNEACSFLIQPGGGGSTIVLSFTDFNTENIPGTDILRVYDGADASGILLGEFWGITLPTDLTATSGSMFLRWASDSSNTFPGYYASWTSTVYTPTPSNTPTSTPTDTPTAIPTDTPTITPTFTPTITETPTETPTPTEIPTQTETPTPSSTPTNIPTPTPTFTPPPTVSVIQTGTPDGSYYVLPDGQSVIINLGIPLYAMGSPDGIPDLVYFERNNGTPGQVSMDSVIVELGDFFLNIWYQIFNWGNGSADTNSNANIANPTVGGSEGDNQVLYQNLVPLYGTPALNTGITIDIDGIPTPGTPLQWLRISAPITIANDGAEIDSILILPTKTPTLVPTPTNTPVPPTDTPVPTPTPSPVPPTATPEPPTPTP